MRRCIALLALAGCGAANNEPIGQAVTVTIPSRPPAGWPRVWAHRGGAGERPENTLEAFRHAREGGPVVLEMDVRFTREGVPVVFHDARVERTTDGVGEVATMTLAALRALDAGYCFSPALDPRMATPSDCRAAPSGTLFPFRGRSPRVRVPTLDEVFAAFAPEQPMSIELKVASAGAEQALASLVRRHGRARWTCVGSFDPLVSMRLRRALPEACHWAPDPVLDCYSGSPGPCPFYDVLEAPFVRAGRVFVTPAYVARAHAAGVRVVPWTLNDEAEMARALAAGVDGVITDFPTRLRALLSRLREEEPRDP